MASLMPENILMLIRVIGPRHVARATAALAARVKPVSGRFRLGAL